MLQSDSYRPSHQPIFVGREAELGLLRGALVISVATVERHITHIYEKIGAGSQAEATAYALRQGLA
jgi:hypothetical protein